MTLSLYLDGGKQSLHLLDIMLNSFFFLLFSPTLVTLSLYLDGGEQSLHLLDIYAE